MPDTSPRDREYATRRAAQNAITGIALNAGGKTVTRPIHTGHGAITSDVDPASGMRAARDLEQAAHRLTLDYIRLAREAGHTWHDIGTALYLTPDRQSGTTAEAAFDYAADPDSPYARTYGPSTTWTCTTCTHTISDHGPYNHPADNERGHAPKCPRLQATIDAWQADWEAGQ